MKAKSFFSHQGLYLLITCVFQLLSNALTDTTSNKLEFTEQFATTGNHAATESLPKQQYPNRLTQLVREIDKFRPDPKRCKNYASNQCAQVVETNPEARNAFYIVNKDPDEYMLTPCDVKIWFVIELCETIQATHIMLANYELYSSMPKDFTVYFSDIYPTLDWKLVGEFTANNSRTLQTFDLELIGFGKFIRVDLHSHYGNEYYCPISEVRVHGHSMVDEYENKANKTAGDGGKAKRNLNSKGYFKVMTRLVNRSPPKCPLAKPPPTPPPIQQVVANRTTPLKQSVFVELENKVKALEIFFKEEMDRRLNHSQTQIEELRSELRSSAWRVGMIVIAYCSFKLLLDYF